MNHKKHRRVMRQHDLQPRRRGRFVATTDSTHDGPIFPNLPADLVRRGPNQGKTYIDPSVGHHLARVDAADDLTARELDVLRHLALGRSNKDIAEVLGIREETVKTHVSRVRDTLHVENRGQPSSRT